MDGFDSLLVFAVLKHDRDGHIGHRRHVAARRKDLVAGLAVRNAHLRIPFETEVETVHFEPREAARGQATRQ